MSSRLRIPSWAGIRYRARWAAYQANYFAGRFRDRVWVLGDGRSGTTWLGDLVNYAGTRRSIFEPFHPAFEEGMRGFHPVPYVRKGSSAPELEAYVRHVFSGRFHSYHTENFVDGWRYDGLVIKSTFANLFAAWAAPLLPDVPKVLIVRHPCAVAESKCSIEATWVIEPLKFWKQDQLREEYLQPHETLIHETSDPFLKFVICWAIQHAVLLPQIHDAGIHLVHYERLCVDPQPELERVFRNLSLKADPTTDPRVQAMYASPSRTSRKAEDQASDQRVTKWMQRVDKERVRGAMHILEVFGLDGVYGDGALPLTALALGDQAASQPLRGEQG